MGDRLELQDMLEKLIDSPNVYFQPPASFVMDYPCIRYELDDIEALFANGTPYVTNKMYQLTIIDADPDSAIIDKVTKLPKCAFERHYKANNLNHYVYNIYY